MSPLYTRYAAFDMDGTLIDSNQLLSDVVNDYLRAHGQDEDPDLLSRARTMSFDEMIEVLHDRAEPDAPLASTAEAISEGARLAYETRVQAKPGAEALLRSLQARGTRLCVASASEARDIESTLGRLGLLKYFEFIVSCTQVGKNKSFPDVFLAAAERFGCRPEEMTVFEDSLTAMRSAKNAGCMVVGMYDDAGKDELDEAKARWYDAQTEQLEKSGEEKKA